MLTILLPFFCLFHRGLYPFGQYISYTDHSFTIGEIKHLWRKNKCAQKYGRDLNVRVDNFENPSETNVLCSDWNSWKDPIIWLALHLQTSTNQLHFFFQLFLSVPRLDVSFQMWSSFLLTTYLANARIWFLAFYSCQTFGANHFKGVLGKKHKDVGQSPVLMYYLCSII